MKYALFDANHQWIDDWESDLPTEEQALAEARGDFPDATRAKIIGETEKTRIA